jgi:hypothetical protein
MGTSENLGDRKLRGRPAPTSVYLGAEPLMIVVLTIPGQC